MVAALLAVMVGTGLLLGLMQLGVSLNREYASRYEQERAYSLAEAGLAESLVAMRRGGTGVVASSSTPAVVGDGILWTTVAQEGGSVYRVVSSAAVGTARVALEQMVFAHSTDFVDTAIFADDDLVVEANVLVDSFDSNNGTYEDQLAAGSLNYVREEAVVQSNSNIVASAASEVHGDVHPGAGDLLTLASNADVSRCRECLPMDRIFEQAEVPGITILSLIHI